MWSIQFTLISNSYRRVVPSINMPYALLKIQVEIWYTYNLIWFCSHVVECLVHPCSSLLIVDLWRDLSRILYSVLCGFQFSYIVLCGITPGLWFCSCSEIDSKSSRLWCLSLCIAWSHPTLACIKLLTRLVLQLFVKIRSPSCRLISVHISMCLNIF